MHMQSPLIDVKTLRARARMNIEEGAVTNGYAADRATVLRLLDESLATELVCVLRYRRHHFMARGIHSQSVAQEFLDHSNEEQGHADQIAERIVQLGGSPDFAPNGLVRPQPRRIRCRRHAGKHDPRGPGCGANRHRQLPRHHPLPRRPGPDDASHAGGNPGRGRATCRRTGGPAGGLPGRCCRRSHSSETPTRLIRHTPGTNPLPPAMLHWPAFAESWSAARSARRVARHPRGAGFDLRPLVGAELRRSAAARDRHFLHAQPAGRLARSDPDSPRHRYHRGAGRGAGSDRLQAPTRCAAKRRRSSISCPKRRPGSLRGSRAYEPARMKT